MAFLFTDMHILVGNARNKSFICFKKHLPITVYGIIDILSTGLPRKKWLHLKKCLILIKPCYIKLFDTFLKRFFTSRIKKQQIFLRKFPLYCFFFNLQMDSVTASVLFWSVVDMLRKGASGQGLASFACFFLPNSIC